MPPPSQEHGAVVSSLNAFLFQFVRTHDLGVVNSESGYQLAEDPDTVRAPDISFTAKARLTPMTSPYPKAAPDLAVEVASPGNTASDMNDKIVQYFEAGVRLVWLVYPKTRTLHVYRSAKEVHILDESDTLEGEPVLPGFRLPVREVFAQLRG